LGRALELALLRWVHLLAHLVLLLLLNEATLLFTALLRLCGAVAEILVTHVDALVIKLLRSRKVK